MLALRRSTFAVLSLATLSACGDSRSEYRFFLDGESIEPEILALVGEPGAPAAGDVVVVGGHRSYKMVLDGPGEYRYETTRKGNLRREYPDGRVPLVHLVLGDAGDAKFEETPTPSELRGVLVSDGWGEHAGVLESVSVDRCLLEFRTFADDVSPESISERTAYLDVRFAEGDLSHVGSRLPDLRYFAMRIRMASPKEEPGIGWERTEQSIDWVAGLHDLRYLSVAGTGVRNLRPLGGHPNLRYLFAGDTPVESLPTVLLPKLRVFEAADWTCSGAEVQRFREQQPDTRIVVGPTERLRDRLRGVAGLRAVRRHAFGPDGEPLPTVFTTQDPREVASLVALLRFEDDYNALRGFTPAGTNLQLQFLDEHGEVMGSLEFIPPDEQVVRAYGLMAGERRIPEDVREAVAKWFAIRGVALFR